MEGLGIWITENALAAAITIIGTAIATFLSKKIASLMDTIEAKNNIDIDDKVEERIVNVIRRVVLAISQTYVSGLKDKGKFDGKAKKKALEDAVTKSANIIYKEIGVVKERDEIKEVVEATIGEHKVVERMVLNANKGPIKKKKKKKNS